MSVSKCRKLDDWSSGKDNCMCDCGSNKACKTDEYLDIKNCSCKKCLFGKLALACEDEILNITETSLNDKKVTCEKDN